MRRLLLPVVVILGVLVGLVGLGGCKGDRTECEAACRNYATLVYPKITEDAIAKLPEAEREAARRTKAVEFDSLLENGVDMCINQCRSANNDDMNACMLKAKTADEAFACVKQD